jgi:protease-4
MKSFLRNFFACLLALIILLVVVIGVVAFKSMQKPKIKDHSYLVVDIYGEIPEYSPPTGVMGQIVGGCPETLTRILTNLEKVCVDDRIDGVILKLSSSNNVGHAKLQEIRGAVRKIQQAGKKVYAYSDAMNRKTYFLAAACDSIFMPPSAWLDITGYAVVSMHVKKALEKLDIKPNLHQIKDHKAAAELITREDMSDPVRENREWMMAEFWEMYTQALNADRGLDEAKIVEIMEQAMFIPQTALEAGLIDAICFWDEFEELLMPEGADELHTVSQGRYADVDPGDLGLKGKKKIAVVHAQGLIGGRESGVHPLLGMVMGHETVCGNLQSVCKDEDIAAVVFRVDSGGGEGTASDMIGHEVHVTTEEKPVVVSMVDVAGSGGYTISYRASKIVANPMTVTGSIGSISMKLNFRDFYKKLGITFDSATRGPNALFWSEITDFTKEQREAFEEFHWADYDLWIADIAKFRGLSIEELAELGHGRVWSGRQARENGLIDELGGLDRAIELARELAEIPADDEVTVVHYPKQKNLIESILSGEGDFSTVARWIVYRALRTEITRTWDLLSHGPLQLSEELPID